MAIGKNPIHADIQHEDELEEQRIGITNSTEEHDFQEEINRQDGPGRDDGYIPDPTAEQGVENEIDRVPAGEEQEQISEKSSGKDMDWER